MHKVINNISLNYSYYKNKNKTKALLFLHGFGGTIESFSALEQALQPYYHTINLSLPGFFCNGEVPNNFTIYDYAKLIFNFLNELNIKKVCIISHSFGGRIAIILASMYSEMVEKLVLIDSAGIKPRFSIFTYIKIKYFKLLKLLINFKIIKKNFLNKFCSSDYKNLSNNEKQVFNNIIKEDLSYLLKNIKIPTLIIWGKRDKSTPYYMAKKLKKSINYSRLILYKKAGHFCYLEEAKSIERNIHLFFLEENI